MYNWGSDSRSGSLKKIKSNSGFGTGSKNKI
jgi:hypothetical protein